MDLIGLFFASFLAATLVPFSSELALGGMALADPSQRWTYLLVASSGNIIGAVVNWSMGMWALRFQNARWFPFKPAQLERAQTRFASWGVGALLLSWVPIIGDPITFAAGVMRVPFMIFLLIVGVAKTARYAVVLSVI